MRKVIAAFNMTLDGVCDHTTGIPSEDLHQHYADLLDHTGAVSYTHLDVYKRQIEKFAVEK